MPKDVEDDLKLGNWLSILTYDAFKYSRAGGAIRVEWTDTGLVLHLDGVTQDSVHDKFHRIVTADIPTPEEPAP